MALDRDIRREGKDTCDALNELLGFVEELEVNVRTYSKLWRTNRMLQDLSPGTRRIMESLSSVVSGVEGVLKLRLHYLGPQGIFPSHSMNPVIQDVLKRHQERICSATPGGIALVDEFKHAESQVAAQLSSFLKEE